MQNIQAAEMAAPLQPPAVAMHPAAPSVCTGKEDAAPAAPLPPSQSRGGIFFDGNRHESSSQQKRSNASSLQHQRLRHKRSLCFVSGWRGGSGSPSGVVSFLANRAVGSPASRPIITNPKSLQMATGDPRPTQAPSFSPRLTLPRTTGKRRRHFRWFRKCRSEQRPAGPWCAVQAYGRRSPPS